ncbi:hypothetical protein ADUPG1_009396, partial [Aduncisulcus paluster]
LSVSHGTGHPPACPGEVVNVKIAEGETIIPLLENISLSSSDFFSSADNLSPSSSTLALSASGSESAIFVNVNVVPVFEAMVPHSSPSQSSVPAPLDSKSLPHSIAIHGSFSVHSGCVWVSDCCGINMETRGNEEESMYIQSIITGGAIKVIVQRGKIELLGSDVVFMKRLSMSLVLYAKEGGFDTSIVKRFDHKKLVEFTYHCCCDVLPTILSCARRISAGKGIAIVCAHGGVSLADIPEGMRVRDGDIGSRKLLILLITIICLAAECSVDISVVVHAVQLLARETTLESGRKLMKRILFSKKK